VRTRKLFAAALPLVLVPAGSAAQGVECAPALVGPIASTEESRAYRPASSPPLPEGYVDEEYVITCQALGVQYRTALNVRRPTAPDGPRVVVLEPTHPSNSWPVLRFTHEYQERAGIVSVAVHATPSVVERLMKPSNPERYAGLEVPDEQGIEEAILAQVGTRVRLSGLPGVEVGALILGGYSYTGGVTRDYVERYHRTARAPDGGPVYQGYFPNQTAVGRMPGPLPDLDVPVIELQGEREIIATFERNPDGLGYRRPDGELYRLYEVPGMAHLDTRGDEDPNEACGIDTPSQFPMAHVHDVALRNLVEWVRDGVPAPRAARIELEGNGPAIARDDHGNALGGVRTSYLDVPVATYETVSERQPGTTGGRCDMLGPQFDFAPDELRALYGSQEGYVARLRGRLEELVRDRWYLDFHAAELLREAGARPAF
jgi:hypothetical protein